MSATAIATALPSFAHPLGEPAQARSWVHALALALVAVTIAVSGFVFTEPAPVDALMLALVVLLPTLGLVAINPALVTYFALWAVAGAAAVLAAALSQDTTPTLVHVAVTLYLYLASVVLAAFVAKAPERHTQLILKAWTWAAFAAAAAALVGYFGLLPGTYDLFTKFGRAAGTFKDPNVLGPFLTAPLLYMLHVALVRSTWRIIAPLIAAAVLALAVLVTFSRGAWINLAVALFVYGYLTLLTSDRAATRLKIMGLLTAGLLFAVGLVAISLQTDYIADLLVERSSVTMEYDTGEEGRFGGQEKAIGLIADNPLGIGAQQFVTHHHPEEVHNVYLNMLLNAGWLGGGVYWTLVALTLVLGFRHALKATPTRPLFLIVYAAFVAVALEGLIIDTDHWRHFYLLMAVIWGLMCARPVALPNVPAPRTPRIRAHAVPATPARRSFAARRPKIVAQSA